MADGRQDALSATRPQAGAARRDGSPATSPPGAAGGAAPAGERLQRTLARAGLGSRRSVEDLIRAGRVRINGQVAQLGNRVDLSIDSITLDGVPVPTHPELRYLALNKPAGVTTTMSDPHAERTLRHLVPPGPRVVAVGRLDRDSEGLLLLTNDGSLAHRLQHPRYGVEKEYLVEVDGAVPRPAIRALVRGVRLEDGLARALRAEIVQRRGERSAVSVVMAEGRKREVRRMLATLGFQVRRLVRTRIGPVRLGSLQPGTLRELSPEEVHGLYRLARLDVARPRDGALAKGAGRLRPPRPATPSRMRRVPREGKGELEGKL